MKLLDPVQLGRLQLKNRIIMAPMTRSRAEGVGLPSQLHVDYYSQRASAGLIITEGCQPSVDGQGYCRSPGIHSSEQISAWKKVTQAVHQRGGKIVMQLMHVGRIASAANKAPGARTLAPSAIRAKAEIFTEGGMLPCETPEEMTLEDIQQTIDDYSQAAVNAYEAGFDGVELHCTSGYLPAQFLSTGTNHRNDAYGGSLEHRIRFPLEVLQALVAIDGADRVGFRICPGNPFNDLSDDNPSATFAGFLQAASPLGLAYLHVIRMQAVGIDNIGLAQANFSGPLIVNESYTAEEAEAAIAAPKVEAVSFARPFIANPDFVERTANHWPLAQLNPKTLYTPGAEGYSDYPSYAPN